jgi:hypothetical protein
MSIITIFWASSLKAGKNELSDNRRDKGTLTSVFTSSGHSVHNPTQIQRTSDNFIPSMAL